MTEITVEIKFYGAFRKFGENILFTVPKGCKISDVKQKMAGFMDDAAAALIKDSVLANDENILSETATLNQDTSLSILPPVCGG